MEEEKIQKYRNEVKKWRRIYHFSLLCITVLCGAVAALTIVLLVKGKRTTAFIVALSIIYVLFLIAYLFNMLGLIKLKNINKKLHKEINKQ